MTKYADKKVALLTLNRPKALNALNDPLVKSLLQHLAFAAVVSFLTSPVLAIINYVVMSGENVPEKDRLGTVLKVLSLVGILFFSLMALGYLYVTFIYDGA